MSAVTAVLYASSSAGSAISGLISFVLWILVMVWTYNIAKRKGRHAVGWTILSFFFWIIPLIVVLLLPSKRTTDRYSPY